MDLKLMEDRIGIDVTHFTNINDPTIFALPVASSSGYYKQTVNGFTTQKKGWEVSMTSSILENQKGLNWDVMVNWSTYKETLNEGLSEKAARAMMAADPKYLKAAFESLTKKYGTVDKFLEVEMELTPDKRNLLQEKLLY